MDTNFKHSIAFHLQTYRQTEMLTKLGSNCCEDITNFILTRLGIDNKSARQKSEEFESDQEKIGKYKKLNIYLYFELIFFYRYSKNHVHTLQDINKCPKDINSIIDVQNISNFNSHA